MTSVEPTERRPRHQWGSIFIALFFIELIIFGPLAWSLNAKIEQLRGYLDTKIAWSTQIEIGSRTKQLNQLYLASGILLTGTLVCAVVSLRRRKAPSQ